MQRLPKSFILSGAFVFALIFNTYAQKRDIAKTKELEQLPGSGIPYGRQEVLQPYKKQWLVSEKGDTVNLSYDKKMTENIDSLSAYLYQQYNNIQDYKIANGSSFYQELIHKRWFKKAGFPAVPDTANWYVLKLIDASNYSIFVTMAQYRLPCKNCEYPSGELLAILFTVADGKVVSKQITGYTSGSDLSRRDRYFYITHDVHIISKDFSFDELNAASQGSRSWKITPEGKISSLEQ